MQDKHFHIDKTFTDRAWRDMRSMLDQEMPTDPRGKQPFWWWVLGSAMLFLLAGSLHFSKKTNAPDAGEPVKSTLPTELPMANAKDDQPVTELENENKVIGEKSISRQQNQQSTAEIQAERGRTNSWLKAVNPAKEMPAGKGDTKNDANALTTNAPIAFDSNIKRSEFEMPDNPTRGNQETVTMAIDRTMRTDLARLPFSKPTVLKVPVDLGPVFQVEKTKKVARNTLFVSNLFSLKSKTNGLSVGFLRNFPIRSKRLSLEMGLGYDYIAQPVGYVFQQTVTELPVLQIGDVLYDFGYANDTRSALVTANSVQEDHDPISSNPSFNRLKLHYLSLPVQLNWNKGRAFLSGGLKGGVLLFASNSSFSGGLFKSFDSTDNRALVLTQPNSESSNDIPETSKFDLAATVGMGYNLSGNAGISLHYSHGMLDVIKHNNHNDFNRLWQLSIRYSL